MHYWRGIYLPTVASLLQSSQPTTREGNHVPGSQKQRPRRYRRIQEVRHARQRGRPRRRHYHRAFSLQRHHVTSLVKDVVTPPIGQLTGLLPLESIPLDLLNLGREVAADTVATIKIGNFVNVVIDFLITAIAVFLLIKFVNKLNEAVDDIGDMLDGEEEEAAPSRSRNRSLNPNR